MRCWRMTSPTWTSWRLARPFHRRSELSALSSQHHRPSFRPDAGVVPSGTKGAGDSTSWDATRLRSLATGTTQLSLMTGGSVESGGLPPQDAVDLGHLGGSEGAEGHGGGVLFDLGDRAEAGDRDGLVAASPDP